VSRRLARLSLALALVGGLSACGPSKAPPEAPPGGEPTSIAYNPDRQSEVQPLRKGGPDDALTATIRTTLAEVARARGLPPKGAVAGRRLRRDEVIGLIMTKTERDLPKGVLEAQGDLLRGLGLMPADYRFVDGIYDLIRKNVAGFYDEDQKTMFLLDDLGSGDRETLVHELEHAIQDQHFDLGKLIQYTPGDSDRVTAAHAIAEGDAMSVMFEVMLGDAFLMAPKALRFAMVASVAFAEGGTATPRVLQASLIAPYVDGFTFVQGLRKRGGWQEVDAAFRQPPTSTEQLLHLDKFDAREPAIAVPVPPLPAGDGWTQRDADVLGEQGLRMVLEQWGRVGPAAKAAAGWGGDRYLVAQRADDSGGDVVMVGWHLVFDSPGEAKEAAAFIRRPLKSCAERSEVGPLAFKHRGDAVAVVAGPFRKVDGEARGSAGSCALAGRWLDAILATR
jgi:hypothetical protein